MTIFTLLEEDHKKVKELLERLESTTERAAKTRTEVLAKVEQELAIHMEIEERILYPALREKEKTHEIALEAYAEHEAATDVLKKLKTIPADSEMWKAWLMVLKENIEHHIEEEQTEMFPKARKLFEREELQAMAKRAEDMKAELKSRGMVSRARDTQPQIEAEEE
jgi:iron-sulfur cluster repair protein YtfE (RIC family)